MLNQNIKNLRKQKGYTQETFAQELNVVRQTVSKWEKGYSVPDAIMLEKIAELLDVSVGELLGDVNEKNDDKPDLREISEQLSILNNQFAKELSRKRRNRKIAIIALSVVLALILGFVIFGIVPHEQAYYQDSETGDVIARKLDKDLDEAVSNVIFSKNPVDTLLGECPTESHFVLGTKEEDDKVTVYLIEDYMLFGFRNGFFTDVSGGVTPVVLTFNKTDGGYELISRETARDGDYYAPSIKKLFPSRYAKKILRGLSQEENEELWINQVKQAQKYLESINRNAIVCKYGDMKIEFLSDYGIETEVSNKVCEMGLGYDYTIGNHELIEDGKRYVYQTGYDEANALITFTKFEYDTQEIVEFFAVDAETGEDVENAPKPEKVKYYKGQLGENQFTTVAYYQ